MSWKEDAMKKELKVNDDVARGKSADKPNVQGAALQVNDNSAGGKKPAKPSAPPEAKEKPSAGDVQGRALRVNENGVGE